MIGGYAGKILFVDLSNRKLESEPLSDNFCRDYLGGYGFGLRIAYDRQRPGVNALSPENIIGVAVGPLTGTPAVIGTRFTVMGKSPLTGTWGDANCSGFFGPMFKKAGYDAVFFNGVSDESVYLFIDNGKAELKSAASIWGKTTYETEDILKKEHGSDLQVASIGPTGEKLGLVSCVIHDKGRAAARFGLGAVFGSKKVKAIAVRGKLEVPLAFPETVSDLRKKYVNQIRVEKVGFSAAYMVGTPGYTATGAVNGDSPVKNWIGTVDFTMDAAKSLAHEKLFAYRTKKYGCWRCPIVCGGVLNIENGPFAIRDAHQPEYETMAAFGSNCMNFNLESIAKANDICNAYGMDTISVGSLVAFAMECYEQGLIMKSDLDGLELSWGNAEAIVRLTQMIAECEGFGNILAQGLEKAAQIIGQGSEEFAVHVRGDAIAMHDPRFEPAMAVIYKMFPGKHIQASQFCKPPGINRNIPEFGVAREQQSGRGKHLRTLECLCNIVNCSGACLFGYLSTDINCLPEFLGAVTGDAWSVEHAVSVGERISNIRQAFNLREGINLITTRFPSRALGTPPLSNGPTAGFSVEIETILAEYLDSMQWSRDEARPSKEKLLELGLDNLLKDMYQP